MKLFLNTTLKGLLVALLTVTLGGFLYINLSSSDEINLQLISTSLANQIGTSSYKEVVSQVASNKENSLLDDTNDEKVLTKNKEDKTLDEKAQDESIEETEEKEKEVVLEKEPEINNNIDANKTESNNNTETNDSTQNNQVEPPKVQNGYAPNLEVANSYSAIETYYGKMTAYGPDCLGCGGYVAHGEYVGEGNIYYNDKTFGRIRIVAGDSSLPFGTIVRIKGLSIANPLIAVVLDTGGDIGFNKPKQIYFDLLYESEGAASSFGMPYATYEILRKGF